MRKNLTIYLFVMFLIIAFGNQSSFPCCTIDLRSEADHEVRKFIDSRILKHSNGDFFSSSESRGYPRLYQFWQYKSLEYSTLEKPLSDIDKLNGIEWMGIISIKAKAMRKISFLQDVSSRSWREWEAFDSPLQILIKKKRGTWRIAYPNEYYIGTTAPSVSSVDNVLTYPMDDYSIYWNTLKKLNNITQHIKNKSL